MWFILTMSVPSIPEASSSAQPLAGERVAITGKLALLSRRDARALVERLGGRVLDTAGGATIIISAEFPPGAAGSADGVRVMSEEELCETAGLPASDALRAQFKTSRDIRAMYPNIRDEHLRFFAKWGLVRPVAGRFYGFSDLHLIRQAAAELESGTPLQAIVRSLSSRREGQLQLDFQTPRGRDAAPAEVAEPAPAYGRGAPPEVRDPIHAVVHRSDGRYVAECLEVAVVTQGRTVDEVLRNLREAVALHLEGEDARALGVAERPRLSVTYEVSVGRDAGEA